MPRFSGGRYFNPRSPYGERHHLVGFSVVHHGISIHAPRTGSDRLSGMTMPVNKNFNPRSPYGERLVKGERRGRWTVFQSTLPVRGATTSLKAAISALLFQSTLPVRGATKSLRAQRRSPYISIHAPRTGSDFPAPGPRTRWRHFNPRSPYGERRCIYCGC